MTQHIYLRDRALPEKECISKLSPLSTPRNGTSFLSLSREIRDSIYQYALVSSSPLIAWAGMPLGEFQAWQNWNFSPQTPAYLNISNYISSALPTERTAPKIFLSNSIIHNEAAVVFYSKNTFRFVGEWSWDEVVAWIQGIGRRNQSYLTRLELSLRKPQHVWQLRDGARTQLDPRYGKALAENARERTYPCSKFLYLPENSDVDLEGIVENINPAVETVFRLLGETKGGSKITLSVLLGDGCVPGVQISIDDQHPYGNWMSMDLPNIMEKCRELYTVDGMKSLEVLWKCEEDGPALDRGRRLLEDKGWEIVEVYDEEYFCWTNIDGDTRFSHFTMRRKPIDGVIAAEDPSPHSWIGY